MLLATVVMVHAQLSALNCTNNDNDDDEENSDSDNDVWFWSDLSCDVGFGTVQMMRPGRIRNLLCARVCVRSEILVRPYVTTLCV